MSCFLSCFKPKSREKRSIYEPSVRSKSRTRSIRSVAGARSIGGKSLEQLPSIEVIPATPVDGNGYTSDFNIQNRTKYNILADLRIEFEDAEDDAPIPESSTSISFPDAQTPGYFKKSGSLVQPQSRLGIPNSANVTNDSPLRVSDDTQLKATPYNLIIPASAEANDDSPLEAVPFSISIPIVNHEVVNLEAGADSIKRSYLSIIPTTIQPINETMTLFVWRVNLHPAIHRRFSSMIVSIKLTPGPPLTRPKSAARIAKAKRIGAPSVTQYAPRKSFGATSSEQKTISWGLELPISVPAGPVSVGVTPSTKRETQKKVEHAFTITGSSRGSPAKHTCVWTVEENESTERGIPSELQLAAVLQHMGPVMMEIDISGWTAGGYLPTHHLRPRTDAIGRKKVIDTTMFEDLLLEYDFDEANPLEGCKKLLEKWTGKVDGAVLEFDQQLAQA